MEIAFIASKLNALMFCKEEAVFNSEGTPIIEGTFRPTSGTWTGIFESINGQVYEIYDGYIKKEVSAS